MSETYRGRLGHHASVPNPSAIGEDLVRPILMDSPPIFCGEGQCIQYHVPPGLGESLVE